MTTSPPETAETVLLDTSTLIAGRPIPGKVNTISVVSVAELADGVHAARTPAERAVRLARLDAVASTFDPVPFDAAVARTYGRVAAAVRAAGRQSRPRLAGRSCRSLGVNDDGRRFLSITAKLSREDPRPCPVESFFGRCQSDRPSTERKGSHALVDGQAR